MSPQDFAIPADASGQAAPQDWDLWHDLHCTGLVVQGLEPFAGSISGVPDHVIGRGLRMLANAGLAYLSADMGFYPASVGFLSLYTAAWAKGVSEQIAAFGVLNAKDTCNVPVSILNIVSDAAFHLGSALMVARPLLGAQGYESLNTALSSSALLKPIWFSAVTAVGVAQVVGVGYSLANSLYTTLQGAASVEIGLEHTRTQYCACYKSDKLQSAVQSLWTDYTESNFKKSR